MTLRTLFDRRRAAAWMAAGALVAALGLPAGSQATGWGFGHGFDREYIGTWAASPQTQNATQVAREFAAGTTIRQIVRVSLGGVEIRVRFSNELGTVPLQIGAASVGLHAGGPAIVAGSDRPLTFGGKTSIVVPPGAPAVSDPVHLRVPPLADLAISLYLPAATSGTTFHNVASQTNHIAPAGGDYTAAVVMPTEATALNYFFLSGVTVKASERAHAVVALGDSITDGTRSTPDTNSRWPNTLALRLQEDRRTDHIAVLNEGISGNRILSAGSGPNMLSRFDRDVLAKRAVKHIVLLIGINDIGNSARGTGPVVTADDIIAGYRQLIARARQHDIRIYVGTLTPIAGSGYDFPAAEAMRQAVNHWIRTSGAFDGVVDFDALTRDPADPARFLPAFDSGDHLHPNDAGYAAMGRAIPLSWFRH